jgi:hypothetical protein
MALASWFAAALGGIADTSITATLTIATMTTGILTATTTFAGSSAFCCLHHAASPNWRGRFFASFGGFKRLSGSGVTPVGDGRNFVGSDRGSPEVQKVVALSDAVIDPFIGPQQKGENRV